MNFIVPKSGAGSQTYNFNATRRNESIAVRKGDFIGFFYENMLTNPSVTALGKLNANSNANIPNTQEAYISQIDATTILNGDQMVFNFPTFTQNYATVLMRAMVEALPSCVTPEEVEISKYQPTVVSGSELYIKCGEGEAISGTEGQKSLRITCGDGQWAPPPSKCEEQYNVVPSQCVSVGINPNSNPADIYPVGTYAFPSIVCECDGMITRWEYFAANFDPNLEKIYVYICVWRRIGNTNDLFLVGATRVVPANSGYNVVVLQPGQFIGVRQGDFIGFFYMGPRKFPPFKMLFFL